MADFPRICLSVTGETPEELLENALQAGSLSRFVELRLDYLEQPQEGAAVVRAVHRKGIQAIATLRGAAAGGKFQGSAEEQLAILDAAGTAGANLLDLELEAAEHLGLSAVRKLRKAAPLLLSFHDYRETPRNPALALNRLKSFPADYYKLVTLAGRHQDNAAVLDLMRKEKGKLVAFTMGEIGQPTRILCLVAGSPFTYAAPPVGGVDGLGQIPWEQMIGLYRANRIGPRTKVYGVVGNPVAHSLSPAVHNAAFSHVRRDAVYLAFCAEDFKDFRAALSAYRLAGVSVTMPHKKAAAAAVAWKDELATRAGAVNTMVLRGGKWQGYNTDMLGILGPLEQRTRVPGSRVLVAGAGGVARAAALALADAGADVTVVARRARQAADLAQQAGGSALDLADLNRQKFDIIVHATPLGMSPNTEESFFTLQQLNARLLFETVYTPLETRLVRLARARRIKVILGLEMFIDQAAAQFRLWTGRNPPRAVMEQAARAALFASSAL